MDFSICIIRVGCGYPLLLPCNPFGSLDVTDSTLTAVVSILDALRHWSPFYFLFRVSGMTMSICRDFSITYAHWCRQLGIEHEVINHGSTFARFLALLGSPSLLQWSTITVRRAVDGRPTFWRITTRVRRTFMGHCRSPFRSTADNDQLLLQNQATLCRIPTRIRTGMFISESTSA